MDATNPFATWLPEVAADAVVVCPDDVTAEARGNLWTFGLSAEQRAAVTPGAVEEFVRAVAAARSQWLTAHGAGAMRFYCWFDAQAGQLRLSLISANVSPLPFGCRVEPVSVLRAVVNEFLRGEPAGGPLLVWVALIPPAPIA